MNWRILINVIFWVALGFFFLIMGCFYWDLSKKEVGRIVIKKSTLPHWEPNYTDMIVSEINGFVENFNKASGQQNRTATIISFVTSAAAFFSAWLAFRGSVCSQADSVRIRGKRTTPRKSPKITERR